MPYETCDRCGEEISYEYGHRSFHKEMHLLHFCHTNTEKLMKEIKKEIYKLGRPRKKA